MKGEFSATSVFLKVTTAALAGMMLGGLFGVAAGWLAPDFIKRTWPIGGFNPFRAAIVAGAFGGVLLGGVLGGFAIVIQVVTGGRPRQKPDDISASH